MGWRSTAALAALLAPAGVRAAPPAPAPQPSPPASAAPAGGRVGAHLSWVRDDAAAGCPDAAAIEAEVAARLGDNPFRRPPSQFVEATVSRQAETFQVTIAMRGPDGNLIGNRSLTSSAGDCRSIATAAALTIAILIDPDALTRPLAPAGPAPPPTRPPPPAADATLRGRLTALAVGGWGALPGPALGAELAATIDVVRRAALGIAGGFFPERRAPAPNDGFAFGLSFATLAACYLPIAGEPSGARLRWELCAGLSAGLLHAVVYAATPVDPGQRWTFAASQMTRIVIPLSAASLVEVGVEVTEPFPRRAFFVEGRPAGMDTVFTQPAVGVTGFVGIGLRWR